MKDLRRGKAVSRRYRNRRIGEFLKELDLTEGRSTGIPKILRAMRANDSPLPIFETDEDRLSLLVRLRVHPDTPTTPQVTPQLKEPIDNKLSKLGEILGVATAQVTALLRTAVQACLRDELQRAVGLADRKHFREALLNPLIQAGWLTQTIPDKPKSRLQKYRLTEAGRAWLKLS